MPSSLSCQEMALTGHFMMHDPQDLQRLVKRVTRILEVSATFGPKRIGSVRSLFGMVPRGTSFGVVPISLDEVVTHHEGLLVEGLERRVLLVLVLEGLLERLAERLLVHARRELQHRAH